MIFQYSPLQNQICRKENELKIVSLLMNDVVPLEPIKNSAHEEKKTEKNFVEHILKASLMERLK